MQELKSVKCWSVWNGVTKQYVGAGGAIVTSDDQSNLVDHASASMYLHLLHENYLRPYPSPFSIALSLDVSECVAISLLNAYDDSRSMMVEGAAQISSLVNSYTELCWAGVEGRSVRIICRGQLPESPKIPARVLIATSGFVTLTFDRITAMPAWMPDNLGAIRNASAALDELLVPRPIEYIQY